MERLEEHNPLLLYAITVATLSILYFLFRTDSEAAVPYNVSSPEQATPGWKGKVLEDLTMKVGTIR